MRFALLATLFCIAACSSDSPSGPDEEEEGLPAMSAKIDGASWSPSIALTAVNPAPGLYSITGTRTSGANNYTIVFALYNIKGPGRYPLGVTPTVYGGTANLSRPPADGWSTPLNGASGEINITTLTANRMVAQFNFDTSPVIPGSPGAPRVTEGVLDIPVSGNAGLALPHQGGTFTGNVGGAFAASGVSVILSNPSGTSTTLAITGTNGTRAVSIALTNMTGPGSYALSGAARTVGVSGAPGNPQATWLSQGTGGGGTVTISSVTATRITGSLTATVVPIAGGASGNLTISGDFDIGRPQF